VYQIYFAFCTFRAFVNYVNTLKIKDLRIGEQEHAQAPVLSVESALKGFEGRLSSLLFPLLAVMAVLGAILLWA
jgi:hypothetical protein